MYSAPPGMDDLMAAILSGVVLPGSAAAVMPPAAQPEGALMLGTQLNRVDDHGDVIACDVVVTFDVDSRRPGYPATWTQPGEAAEYEFTFVGASFLHDQASRVISTS